MKDHKNCSRGRARTTTVAVAAIVLLTLISSVNAIEVNQAERANRRCYNCHAQQRIVQLAPAERQSMVLPSPGPAPTTESLREGLFVDPQSLVNSVHAGVECSSCHTDAAELPHPATLKPVTCTETCHTDAGVAYRRSTHAQTIAEHNPQAPTCTTCHGTHNILSHTDRRSRTYPLRVVTLCADCHAKHTGETPGGLNNQHIVSAYLDSVHGRAVTRGGLIVAATCVDCHRAHDVLPANNEDSSVYRSQVPQTCGQCHTGVSEIFDKSVHGRKLLAGDPNAPVCTDCHTAHAITQAATPGFIRDIVSECSRCHDKPISASGRSLYDTYRLSYHGQVTSLGSDRGARCSNCHGAHDIESPDDPASRMFATNRVNVCRKCHENANANFALFQPHADYRDAEHYTLLHYVWLYFMIVIGGTLAFFGVHSMLWFIRALIHRVKHGPHPRANGGPAIQRFNRVDRINHAFIIVTFFGLTLTGMPLLFSDQPWARALATLFGGIHAAGIFHRIFAVGLICNFAVHFAGIINRCRKHGIKQLIFGPNSMLPRWRDVKDFFAMIRWFFGGRKPTFDRWTYWEKFDYWAEIFGTSVIGFTGLMLWFPESFSYLLPGWMFNVATVIHGYEAMLAVAFIFTIHFFNAHLRVEKFPVDDVMFTGQLSEAEFIEERGSEYARLKAQGRLEAMRVPPAPRWQHKVAVAAGIIAMIIGTTIVILIVLAGLGTI